MTTHRQRLLSRMTALFTATMVLLVFLLGAAGKPDLPYMAGGLLIGLVMGYLVRDEMAHRRSSGHRHG